MARFEDWTITRRRGLYCLETTVYEDNFWFEDGVHIITGPLSAIADDKSWVKTATSNGIEHTLGTPSLNLGPLFNPANITSFVKINQDLWEGRLNLDHILLSQPLLPDGQLKNLSHID